MKIVKEREQQRVAKGNLRRGRAESKPVIIVVLTGWLVDKFVVGQVVAMERKINPRLFLANLWRVSDEPAKVDIRAGSEGTLTTQSTLVSLHKSSPFEFTAIESQDFSICCQPTVVQVSALCLRRTDILGSL